MSTAALAYLPEPAQPPRRIVVGLLLEKVLQPEPALFSRTIRLQQDPGEPPACWRRIVLLTVPRLQPERPGNHPASAG